MGLVMATKTEKVLFLVTIDTECDHDPHWVRSKPLRFESITAGIPERLQPAFDAAGAVPTYLLTVEVMEDEASVGALRALKGRYEYGTHLHSAFIEPEKKFHDYAGVDSPDFQCHCAPDVERRKLENLTNLFVSRFGYRPRSFRAGRFGAGPNTIRSLAQLGYLADTSVTPHIRWRHPDGDVDYRGAPEQPYIPRPDALAGIAPDGRGDILEVPITMRRHWFRGPYWLRPWFSSVASMKETLRYHLRRYGDRPIVVLNMMFHSMEVIAKASPYPQTDGEVQRFLDDLSAVLHWCRGEGIAFSGLADAAKTFGVGHA
jgi:hypothetical protein